MCSTRGNLGFTFSQMVQNTIETHGLRFAVRYYRVKHGLTAMEFRVFAGI